MVPEYIGVFGTPLMTILNLELDIKGEVSLQGFSYCCHFQEEKEDYQKNRHNGDGLLRISALIQKVGHACHRSLMRIGLINVVAFVESSL
jgi:hypothetical protein